MDKIKANIESLNNIDVNYEHAKYHSDTSTSPQQTRSPPPSPSSNDEIHRFDSIPSVDDEEFSNKFSSSSNLVPPLAEEECLTDHTDETDKTDLDENDEERRTNSNRVAHYLLDLRSKNVGTRDDVIHDLDEKNEKLHIQHEETEDVFMSTAATIDDSESTRDCDDKEDNGSNNGDLDEDDDDDDKKTENNKVVNYLLDLRSKNIETKEDIIHDLDEKENKLHLQYEAFDGIDASTVATIDDSESFGKIDDENEIENNDDDSMLTETNISKEHESQNINEKDMNDSIISNVSMNDDNQEKENVNNLHESLSNANNTSNSDFNQILRNTPLLNLSAEKARASLRIPGRKKPTRPNVSSQHLSIFTKNPNLFNGAYKDCERSSENGNNEIKSEPYKPMMDASSIETNVLITDTAVNELTLKDNLIDEGKVKEDDKLPSKPIVMPRKCDNLEPIANLSEVSECSEVKVKKMKVNNLVAKQFMGDITREMKKIKFCPVKPVETTINNNIEEIKPPEAIFSSETVNETSMIIDTKPSVVPREKSFPKPTPRPKPKPKTRISPSVVANTSDCATMDIDGNTNTISKPSTAQQQSPVIADITRRGKGEKPQWMLDLANKRRNSKTSLETQKSISDNVDSKPKDSGEDELHRAFFNRQQRVKEKIRRNSNIKRASITTLSSVED